MRAEVSTSLRLAMSLLKLTGSAWRRGSLLAALDAIMPASGNPPSFSNWVDGFTMDDYDDWPVIPQSWAARSLTMPDEKRDAILDAALGVFAKRGFAAARISDIAAEAGVGKGTVYLYFDSKEDLLLGVLESYVDDMLAMIDELALSGISPREGIRVFFEAALALVASNADLFTIIEQRLFLTDKNVRARGEKFFRSMIERLIAKINVNMKRDTVEAYDMEIVSTAVIGAFSSFRLYRVLHPEQSETEACSKVSAELSRFFAAALLPK